MSEARLFLFDDRRADAWAPFALSRPCGELLFGRWRLRERAERAAGLPASGHLTRPWLRGFREEGAPPALDPSSVPEAPAPTLLWSSRAVPAPGARLPRESGNLWVGTDLAGLALPAEAEVPGAEWVADPQPLDGLPDVEIGGEWLTHAWDLVAKGPQRLAADLSPALAEEGPRLPEGVWRLGDGALALGPGVTLEPGVVLDTREGPIELGDGVEVRAGCRLAGPLYAGPGSRLLGARSPPPAPAPAPTCGARSRRPRYSDIRTRRTTDSWATPTSARG